MIGRAFLLLGAWVMLLGGVALAGMPAASVPTFKLRARVTHQAGAPVTDQTFRFSLSDVAGAVTATGAEWSDYLVFDAVAAEATVKRYPNSYNKRWPVVVKLSVAPVVDPTLVEAELVLDGTDGAPVVMTGELFGATLGLCLWQDEERQPRAASMAAYNRRFWAHVGAGVPPAERPQKFPIIDRFIGGDHDQVAWREGIENLSKAGFSAIMLPPEKRWRDVLLANGGARTAWAVYSPPGYAFAFDPGITSDSLKAWAAGLAEPFLKAGYQRTDMAAYTISDEPGWYYPQMFAALEGSASGLRQFRDYLRAQGLQPADLGHETWDTVKPLGRSHADELPARRLYYWTTRFFPWASSRHFAAATRAMEDAFYPDMPIITNWNFFAGRYIVPGPVANNRDKKNPDAGMGGHEWFEFGELRGGTMLWTEDWFGDEQAYQWSFYASKLRCAAKRSGVRFGGYVIPRTAGSRDDGIVQKIMCLVGSGGKTVKYFVFGPEYNFPGNCYSYRAELLPKMAAAHRMIGAAEDLLWPGERPAAQVAILMPRSAQPWDAMNIPIPTQIYDATNTDLLRATVDYMAEVYGLYLALQHANIPVDFVTEDDLAAKDALKDYRVLYVTEPNVPRAAQEGLVRYVREGGTVVTTSAAVDYDEYNEPCNLIADEFEFDEEQRDRLLIRHASLLPKVTTGEGGEGAFTAVGAIGRMKPFDEEDTLIEACFAGEDEEVAVINHRVRSKYLRRKQGRLIHFAWLPGVSYAASSTARRDKLPVAYSADLRQWITWPTRLAGVTVPVVVDRPMIETPLLLSDAGAAVTLLNWTGQDEADVTVTVTLPFAPVRVASVLRGELAVERHKDTVTVTLPLGATDVLLFHRQ